MRNTAIKLSNISKRQKIAVLVVLDFLGAAACIALAFVLRFSTVIPQSALQHLWPILLLSVIVTLFSFWAFGVYRAILRHGVTATIPVITKGLLTTAAVMSLVIYAFVRGEVSMMIIPIYLSNFAIYAIGYRLAIKALIDRNTRHTVKTKRSVAIYGAGEAGVSLLHSLHASPSFDPVAFFDDNHKLHGRTIEGCRIYAPNDVKTLVTRYNISNIILAIPSLSKERRHEILRQLEPLHIKVQSMPAIDNIVDGKAHLSDIDDISAEDLLWREAIQPNTELMARNIHDKSVMVTGGGGSIGSELCRQILMQNPKRLVVYEMSELALYKIEQELTAKTQGTGVELGFVLGSVCNEPRLEKTIRRYGTQTIYHAAAYKHVPIIEHNPTEGIINNVLGTQSAIRAAQTTGVETFVLISTDKAVRPPNVMGASKRVAEQVVQGAAAEGGPTRFAIVRFGNVMDSTGSAIPLFRKQIHDGGPITLTHPDVTRYFMTIPEAAQLVIQAGAMARGGEVFVLRMGEPVRIMDLAKRMIHLNGLTLQDDDTLDGDICIEIIGLRPGEKLHEELLIGTGTVEDTDHAKIMLAHETFLPQAQLAPILARLSQAAATQDAEAVKSCLNEVVEGFSSTKTDPAAH